jgi:uncharacterized protein
MRAIDFHVHLPTPDWLDGSMAGYVEAAEAYFRSRVERQSLDELAAKYRALNALAVLLAWDAETATRRPRVPNSTVAAAVREHPDAFAGIGSVDPHKESAVDEVAEIAALGLRGVKFHPSLQAFAPDDERFWPVFAACESHGLLALFHTGTSGIGARQPGGQGIRIDYAHPLKLDAVAAAFPGLTVVAAHFGWPWHLDLLAMALHKTNVYIDISGWSPKRIPAEVTRELKGRLAGQFLWGSDFPFIAPERCLGELEELGLDSPVLLRDNAARVLGLPALPALGRPWPWLSPGRSVPAEPLKQSACRSSSCALSFQVERQGTHGALGAARRLVAPALRACRDVIVVTFFFVLIPMRYTRKSYHDLFWASHSLRPVRRSRWLWRPRPTLT